MECPDCGGNSRVKDSRKTGPDRVYRRRQCLDCYAKWSTTEIASQKHREITKRARKARHLMNKALGELREGM